MKYIRPLCTLLFGVAVFLFFGLLYPHHLHYHEQFQLFLFDSNYVWDIIRLPGGVADLLGRFCTQFFLYAWVGAAIIALLLSAVQLLMLRLTNWGILYGLSFVPSFLLWLFLLDENALLGGLWAVLFTLLAVVAYKKRPLLLITLPLLYYIVGPVCLPLPVKSLWLGVHYYRYPTEFPTLLWAAALSALILPLIAKLAHKHILPPPYTLHLPPSTFLLPPSTFLLTSMIFGYFVWQNANFKAEKVMQYDFMARYQQWNRIIEAINTEKPNNQIGVTVQNLALAMHGVLIDRLFDYNQNGTLGLLPDIGTDAISPLPTSEAFYQLGMTTVAQRTVFEAQEAILDFQKSGRCYKRLAQTNLIHGSYEVARKYLMALQKTLFYREWATETLPLLGNEEAINKHPEYGRLRQMAYKEDFYFGNHVSAEELHRLYFSNTSNRLAYQYLVAYYLLTGDRDGLVKLQNSLKQ